MWLALQHILEICRLYRGAKQVTFRAQPLETNLRALELSKIIKMPQ